MQGLIRPIMQPTSSINRYNYHYPGFGCLNFRQEKITILVLHILGFGFFLASMISYSQGYSVPAEAFKHLGSLCTVAGIILLIRRAVTCCKAYSPQSFLGQNLGRFEYHPYFETLSLNDMFFPQKVVNRLPSLGMYHGKFKEGNRCLYIGFIQVNKEGLWQYNFLLLVERENSDRGPKCFTHPTNNWEITFHPQEKEDMNRLKFFLKHECGYLRNAKGTPWWIFLKWPKEGTLSFLENAKQKLDNPSSSDLI